MWRGAAVDYAVESSNPGRSIESGGTISIIIQYLNKGRYPFKKNLNGDQTGCMFKLTKITISPQTPMSVRSLLSPNDVARLLNIAETTIKRWADEQALLARIFAWSENRLEL